jgi:hypothetical protein
MDLHGKLALVLLQLEQTDVTKSQAVVTNKFGPTSAQKQPVAITNHHIGIPYLPFALEHHGLLSSRKICGSIVCTKFLMTC